MVFFFQHLSMKFPNVLSLCCDTTRSRGTIVRGTLLGKERQARRKAAAVVPLKWWFQQKEMGLNGTEAIEKRGLGIYSWFILVMLVYGEYTEGL
jgi:hypothetical protein